MPKAFLTGANGFLGPHVRGVLRSLGYDVFESTTLLNNSEGLAHDIAQGPWEIVFHMAAMSLPAACRKTPDLAYEVNLVGTIEIAKQLLNAGVRCPLIFFSTAYTYSPGLDGLISETSPTNPTEVYGKTKLAAEQALGSMASVVPFPILVLRLFNHSHKSQSPDFFLPAMYQTIGAAKAGTTVKVPMGDPKLKRDFSSLQDLRSTIAALVNAKASINGFEIYNLCSGVPRELGGLVKELGLQMGVTAELSPMKERMRDGEPRTVFGDASKLASFLKRPNEKRTDQEFIEMFLADISASPLGSAK